MANRHRSLAAGAAASASALLLLGLAGLQGRTARTVLGDSRTPPKVMPLDGDYPGGRYLSVVVDGECMLVRW